MIAPQPAEPRSAHVRAKRTRRRREILRAALHAFRRKGYHLTTLEDIATHLGVRKTALYHYFPDKDSILHACHQESLGELDRILREARRLRGAPVQLRHVIREHVRVMTDTLEGSPLAFEVTALPPEHRDVVIAARDRYERALRRIIDRGIRSRAFRRMDSKIAVFAILGAINWIARWYDPKGTMKAAELGDAYADYLVGGLT